MSRYIIASDGGEMYEPYKPFNNIDPTMMHPSDARYIDNPKELKQKRGPFFSCDGAIHDPHFHKIKNHPYKHISVQPGSMMECEQMHVPGYDERDPLNTYADEDKTPFHTITGYALKIKNPFLEDINAYQFAVQKRHPATTDNDEAFNSWKEKMHSVFGQGKVKSDSSAPGAYKFLPSEGTAPPIIVSRFFPRKEENGEVNPAFEELTFGDDLGEESANKSYLVDLANKIKAHEQKSMGSKLDEDPGYWEEKFKESKKIYTLGSQGNLVDIQSYYSGLTNHPMSCTCSKCLY